MTNRPTHTAAEIAAEEVIPTPADAGFVWVVTTREVGDAETSVGVFRTRLGALRAILSDDVSLVEDLAQYGSPSDEPLWETTYANDTTGSVAWTSAETYRLLEQQELGA